MSIRMMRWSGACLGLLVTAACGMRGADSDDARSATSALDEEVVTCDVAPFKELEIVDPSVVAHATLTSNVGAAAGHWSFRWLMEQMTPPGQDPADFVEQWIMQYGTAVKKVNGDKVDPRAPSLLLASFPRRGDGKLDLAQNPMKLMAIVYRPDLANADKPAGEGRFVFGLEDSRGFQHPISVILEYRLPPSLTPERWAKKFHALGGLAFGEEYAQRLAALTDRFASANAVVATPKNPAGSALAQLRSNELEMGSPWQLREFNLRSGPLTQVTVKETPDHTNVAQMTALGAYASNPDHFAELRSPTFSFEQSAELRAMLGGNSDENGIPLASAIVVPDGQSVPSDILTKIAQNRCDGCHQTEASKMGGNLHGFYHVSPLDPPSGDNTHRLSGFVKQDLTNVRVPKLQSLVCPGAFAAPPTSGRVH